MAADCTLLDEQNSEMDDGIAEEEDVGLDNLPRAKTIMVPRIQNMDNYIIKHYKPYMMQELNKQLAEGLKDIHTETQGTYSTHSAGQAGRDFDAPAGKQIFD